MAKLTKAMNANNAQYGLSDSGGQFVPEDCRPLHIHNIVQPCAHHEAQHYRRHPYYGRHLRRFELLRIYYLVKCDALAGDRVDAENFEDEADGEREVYKCRVHIGRLQFHHEQTLSAVNPSLYRTWYTVSIPQLTRDWECSSRSSWTVAPRKW